MARASELGARAARSDLPVLIEGEAGTGKSFLAAAIHSASPRAARPFLVVDCASVGWDRAEAALFGVVRARAAATPGALHGARNGTLFLRHVDQLPPAAQARLAALLLKGEVAPVGDGRPERHNVRIVTASRTPLLNLARSGEFRDDLYHRLAVLPITLPPLRGRRDVGALAERFVSRFARETEKPVLGIADDAMQLLAAFDWPQNVRQLENALFRAVALAEGARIESVDLPQLQAALESPEAARATLRELNIASAPVQVPPRIHRLKHGEGNGGTPDRFLNGGELTPLADVERALIQFALEHHGGRMSAVARGLGIGRSTLYRKLREYGLGAALDGSAA